MGDFRQKNGFTLADLISYHSPSITKYLVIYN